VRLTRRGIATLAGAAVLFALGQVAGYPVLLGLAAAAATAVLVALAVTGRRPQVEVTRRVYPDRVERGRPAFVELHVRNPHARRQPAFTATDRLGSRPLPMSVRSLAPGADVPYRNEVPTDRRGRHQVGPLTLDRTDALGLGQCRLSLSETATLWVYPRVHPVRVFAAGRPRHHHEGTATEAALRGSLDVREVREYVVGDEVRHLHWKATARTGRLMIRDYADPNQPQFTALLDNRPETRGFEEAVELAASLLVAAVNADHQSRLVTPSGVDVAPGTANAAAVRRLLDELCVLDRAGEPGLPLVPPTLGRARGGSLVVISSAVAPTDRAALAALRPSYPDLVVITLGAAVDVPGAKVLRASDAEEAVRRWHTVIAR
jgi:uncharacterized protein (DUF58 family)